MKVRILLSGEDELSLAQNRYIFSSVQQFIRQSRRFIGYAYVDECDEIIQLSPD
jgi:hypothetical protein